MTLISRLLGITGPDITAKATQLNQGLPLLINHKEAECLRNSGHFDLTAGVVPRSNYATQLAKNSGEVQVTLYGMADDNITGTRAIVNAQPVTFTKGVPRNQKLDLYNFQVHQDSQSK